MENSKYLKHISKESTTLSVQEKKLIKQPETLIMFVQLGSILAIFLIMKVPSN